MLAPVRCAIVCLVSMAVCSCAFVKAVSLPEARGKPGGKLELTLFTFAPVKTPPAPPKELDELPEHVRSFCNSPPRTQPPPPPGPEAGPIVGIVAVAAFTLAFGELTSALSGYVKAKSKRFAPPPYAARANVPAFRFLPGEGPDEAALRCVRLVRTIEENGKETKASDVVISFERPRYGDDYAKAGMIAVLRHLEMQRFAASTRSSNQVVKATVGIAFSLLAKTTTSDVGSVLNFDQAILVPSVKLGRVVPGTFEQRETAIMPEPLGQPATIVISVAETGDGVQEFAAFDEKQFNASTKILGDSLGNILKLKILPNQP